MSYSFDIHFKNNKSYLCELGKKWDTDKSSQLEGSDRKHSHPYTIFYNLLFENRRHDNLNIAEIGILDGGSILMWDEYFPNSKIFGFEYHDFLIDNFNSYYQRDRVILSHMDITNKDSIISSFTNKNVLYDIIIEDSTHEFEDQIRFIENSHIFIKPGGVLIIEDVLKHRNEQDYIDRLKHVLHNFQSFYFVSMDHNNRYSGNWNNDKVFVLVKNGEPLFKQNNNLTIVTLATNIENMIKIRKTMNFDYINEWVIVYNGKELIDNPKIFEYDTNKNKIKEYITINDDNYGNSLYNYALDKIENKETYVYFLDDNNIIHPDFYNILKILDKNKLYTFNEQNRLLGDDINEFKIETPMTLTHYSLCKDLLWKLQNKNNEFGIYINECYEKNSDKWVYINNSLSYYKYLSK
jgi:predicted O-methyltransferase YrrM